MDTLCGTKTLWKHDYESIVSNRPYFGNFDLLFGAAKLALKIVDLPVRYAERTYGSTNIQRWKHGWLLIRMTSLILPMVNTEMMNIFLAQLSEDFIDFFVLMLVDRAGWHRSKGLSVPENVRLIYLPPHSPELNPVEHIWKEGLYPF